MPLLARTWLAAGRLRRRLARAGIPREELVRRHAPGRSFVDVGCMWGVDGAIAFLAEQAGATRVTGLDTMPATPGYEAEHARRKSQVRFVAGDIHDARTVAEVGPHDVVWCSGVLYHSPSPLLTLERLRELTGELLILATEAVPEVPGVSGACVFYPALTERERRTYARAGAPGVRVGVTTPFERSRGYENWWWGITPSALAGMLAAAGFRLEELHRDPFHLTALARPAAHGAK